MALKFADPTNDVAFKKMFTKDNINALKDFIQSIISNAKDFPFLHDLTTIEFLDKEQMPSILRGKRSLCDLKVYDSQGNTYIIEMQKRNEEDYLERVQYYSAHAVTQQLEQGDGHVSLSPVITISIMGRQWFDDEVPCISYHPHRETVTGRQLLHILSHIFIEIPKLDKAHFDENTHEWLEIFKSASALTEMPKVHNKYIKGIYKRLEQHGWSKEEMDAYIEAKIFDDMEKSNLKHAEAKGEARGIEKGIEKGIERMALCMLQENTDLDFIARITGISKDDIINLNKIHNGHK